MTDLEKATEILGELVAKLDGARRCEAEAAAAAASHAYAVHAGGDAGAKKELDRLNSEAARAAVEIKGLEAACASARGKLDEARSAEVNAAERENARAALALLAEFEARGEALDTALARFVGEYSELVKDFHRLDKLGFAPTTHALVAINMKNAMVTALMFSDLQVEHLAPYARRNFRAVIGGWASNVSGRAAARLNRNAPAKAA